MQDYLLERKVSQTPINRKPVPYPSVKTIGILFDASLPENRMIVEAHAKKLKQKGKQVRLLAFYNSRQAEPNFTFSQFTQKELDFFRRPRGTQVKAFMLETFDVLINLFLNEEPALEYISAFIPCPTAGRSLLQTHLLLRSDDRHQESPRFAPLYRTGRIFTE